MATIKDTWNGLSPKNKQRAIVGGACLVVLILAWAVVGVGGGVTQRKASDKIANDLIPRDKAKGLGMSGVAGDVDDIRSEMRRYLERQTKLEDNVRQLQQQGGQAPATSANAASNAALQKQLEELRAEVKSQQTALSGGGESESGSNQSSLQTSRPGSVLRPTMVGPSRPGGVQTGSSTNSGGPVPTSNVGSYGKIRRFTDEGEEGQEAKSTPTSAPVDAQKMYLPSGSLLTGVLLTGIDAPTGKGALKEPVPALVRIKKEAILPNRYRADVRECFVLISGHGDMSSERAYMRSESISCVRTDKQVIDLKAQMFAVGADGKAGIRGRLVSKQGQVIARAALAGLAQGISQAFSSANSPLQLNGNSSPNYGLALEGGGLAGVGSAFDRIAKYYLDLADQIFPVVEIDAGQAVSLVMVKGETMSTLTASAKRGGPSNTLSSSGLGSIR